MSQKQSYAIVPKSLLDKLIYAVEQESMAYADPIAHVEQAAAALEVWQAAPPPPEQVLSDEEIYSLLASVMPEAVRLPPGFKHFARAIEAAVLAKFKESAE